MSIAVGPSDYGMLGSLIANASSVKQKLDTLTNQASTGLIGDTYAGLGTGAPIALNLQPQMANLRTWQNNVDAATGRMTVTQTAMTNIQSIAASFYAQLNTVDGINASAVDSIAASARDALSQVASQLDTQNGGVYVFAGQDTNTAPVPDPDNILTSGFYTKINAAVTAFNGVVPNDAAGTANATFGVATSNVAGTSPFSANSSQSATALRAQLPTVQVGQNSTEKIGLLASANALIPASPPGQPAIPGGPATSTGSYMRDVLRALATMGSLSSSQVNTSGFQALVQDTRTSMSGAITAMAQDVGVLGNTQSSLTTTQSQLADTQTALTGQVTSAEDVDMAKTMSQLSLVQTQMQASYQLIATMSSLSLVKFLPVS
ncbi:MAG: flagellin [Acetobacteraceae bacterium]|jgi:flagellar hook-associated protein 3 FlgL